MHQIEIDTQNSICFQLPLLLIFKQEQLTSKSSRTNSDHNSTKKYEGAIWIHHNSTKK
jgi:hypothetical protein